MSNDGILPRFWKDLKTKEFIPLKILYFTVYGGMFSLVPFLSIRARSLGMSEIELGVINGLLPLFAMLVVTSAGVLADKIGNFKIFLGVTMICSGLVSLLFLSTPMIRITESLPEKIPLEINCTSQGTVSVSLKLDYQCDHILSETYESNVTSCQYVCQSERGNDVFDLIRKSDSSTCLEAETCTEPLEKVTSTEQDSPNITNQQDLRERSSISFQINVEDNNAELTLSTPFCPNATQMQHDREKYFVADDNETDEKVCWLECKAEVDRDNICSNINSTQVTNTRLNLFIYIVINALHMSLGVTTVTLFEGATLSILQEFNGDIGFQRVFMNLGQMIMTPLSGVLIDLLSTDENANYKAAFYMNCGISFLNAFLICFIDLKFKKPKGKHSSFLKLLQNFEIISFIFVEFSVGLTLGILDTFLFWFLQNMGASNSLMGTTIAVGSASGIPMLFFATSIRRRIGHVNILTLGSVFLAIRLIGYSFLTEPWWGLPLESMESITSSLFTAGTVSYAASLSTPSTIVTLQSLSMGMLHGVGRGFGSMIGGFMSKALGLRNTFRVMALVCLSVATVYAILNLIFFRHKERERNNCEMHKIDSKNTEIDTENKLT